MIIRGEGQHFINIYSYNKIYMNNYHMYAALIQLHIERKKKRR